MKFSAILRAVMLLCICTTASLAQGVGADSLRLGSVGGGSSWISLPPSAVSGYRLILPSTLGSAAAQLMHVNGTSGQMSLLAPGNSAELLRMNGSALSWINPDTLISTTAWSLRGNAGTSPSTMFLGTTDAQDFRILTNNTERLRILYTGNVGIGTILPVQRLHIAKGNVYLDTVSSGNAAQLMFVNPAGTFSSSFKAGAQTQNLSYVWPTAAPSLGQFLSTDASGNLSWTSLASLATGTTNNSTLRYNLATSQWVENTNVLATSSGTLTLGSNNNTGSLIISDGQSSSKTATINAASLAANRSYTIPDAGNNANFVMSEGAQTINGSKTFGSAPTISPFTSAGVVKNNASGLLSSGTVSLSSSSDVSGILPVANGGTGVATMTGFPSGNGTAAMTARTMTGTSNQITVTNGDGVAANPTFSIATDPVLPGNGSVTVPIGTSGQQPGTPVNGMMRYNTTSGRFEFYQSGAWATFATGGASLAAGTTTNSTLRWSGAAWIENTQVQTNGATLTVGTNSTPGFLAINDGQASTKTATIGVANLAANRTYTIPESGNSASFVMSEGAQTINGAKSLSSNLSLINSGTATELRFYEPSGSGPNYTAFKAQAQAADISYTLPAADGSTGQLLSTNGSGLLSWATPSTVATSVPLSGISAATATNSINNADYAQQWQWNSLGSTTALALSSASTAAAANSQKLLSLSLSGVNASSSQTTYGLYSTNTHTGTSSTNVGLFTSASGATNNYALIAPAGYVGIGTSTPSTTLHVNGSSLFSGGNLSIDTSAASTAGLLQFYNPARTFYTALRAGANAANVTYTLPTADGSSGQVLTTNGSGTLNWSTALTATTGWSTTGNTGTNSATNFLGTTDAQSLIFKVNGAQELGLNVTTSALQRDNGGNARGSYAVDMQRDRTVATQVASGADATISGGKQNTASGDYSVIAGGKLNTVSNTYAAIIGGNGNTASGLYSVAAGGDANTVSGDRAVGVGGSNNAASASRAVVVGGNANTASGANSFIGAGLSNTSSNQNSFVGAGSSNTASGAGSVVVGGYANTNAATYNAITSGYTNYISALGDYSFIGSGIRDSITQRNAFIGSGSDNKISGYFSFIGAGDSSSISAIYSSLVGGQKHTISSTYSFIGGGISNTISGTRSNILGGESNTVASGYSTILGGVGLTLSSAATNSIGYLANSTGAFPATIATPKTMFLGNSDLWIGNNDNLGSRELRFFTNSATTGAFPAAGQYYTSLKAGASQSANITYTWPTTAPSAGQVLSSDGSGNLSWSTAASGSISGTGAATQVAFFTGATSLASSGNMVWDNTNSRLGIFASSPSSRLQVGGRIIANIGTDNTFLSGGNETISGTLNTGIGYASLASITSGAANVALGRNALGSLTTTNNNVALGNNALTTSTGANNIAIGYQSGDALTTGSNNIIIGYDIDAPSASSSNQMTIGNLIFGTSVNGSQTTISSGNIGIGSNAPSQRLHVAGNILVDTSAASTAGKVIFNNPARTFSTSLKAGAQTANIDYTWPTSAPSAGQYLQSDASGNLSWQNAASSTALSAITAATATNSINSSDYAQTWQWNSLSSNSALTLSSSSTAAASNTQKLLNLSLSGANATASQSTYALYLSNSHTGTSSTNVGAYISASGGSNNYALIAPSGYVGIGTSAPTTTLHVNGASRFSGGALTIDTSAASTAGTIQFYNPARTFYTSFKAGANAANVNYTLPTADGSANQVLTTNGSGTLSWTNSGSVVTYGVNSPSTYSADQTDLSFSIASNSVFRISSTTSVNINSIVAGSDGRQITIINVGSQAITMKHQSATGTAANKMILSKNADAVMNADDVLTLVYDATTARWREMSRNF